MRFCFAIIRLDNGRLARLGLYKNCDCLNSEAVVDLIARGGILHHTYQILVSVI